MRALGGPEMPPRGVIDLMGRYGPQESGTPLRNCNEGDQTRDVTRGSGIAVTASSYVPIVRPGRRAG